MQSTFKALCAVGIALLLSACKDEVLALQVIYQSSQCAVSQQQIKSITSQTQLAKIIGGKPRNFNQKPEPVPSVDFNSQSLVLIAMGQKPSSGYSIQLAGPAAMLKDGQLILPVKFQQPEAGSVQAQVITSPCKILSLAKVEYAGIVLTSGPSY